MISKPVSHLSLLCLATALTTGCTATLHHGEFVGGPNAPKGPMAMPSRAANMPKRIGWGTFTVFGIPVAPVMVKGEPGAEMANQIKMAMEHGGYNISVVTNPETSTNLPQLSCEVIDVGFRNYTYFFPIVFNWGQMKLALTVHRPDGRVIFHNTYNGRGKGTYSFAPTVNKALTELLNDAITDFASIDLSSPTGFICPVLRGSDVDDIVITLKSIRNLNAPDSVPEILPLLRHQDTHVVRDSCRTLAVLGNRDTISFIEPLLRDKRSDVRKDAEKAIAILQSRR